MGIGVGLNGFWGGFCCLEGVLGLVFVDFCFEDFWSFMVWTVI
jgi:hypothetical protein